MATSKIPSSQYYNEYHGHKIEHLEKIYPLLRGKSDALIFTAGDSSLDNKYWFGDRRQAVGAYADILDPPVSRTDVTFWLNDLSENNERFRENGKKYAAINTAVEATTLNERSYRLRAQDKFIRDNISSEDVLIVSIGGNDIALAPAPCTICSVAGLLCLPLSCLENGRSFGAIPCDDCCCGCSASLASCPCSCPPCFGYFRHLFGTRTQKYIEALTSKTKPTLILVCMIYYPDENNTPSWANTSLGALGYNQNPAKIQLLIRKFYEEATSSIKISGTHVIPIPLFHSLDGTRSEDYVARVEPSSSGGKKMAELLLDAIHNNFVDESTQSSGAPTKALIDRSV